MILFREVYDPAFVSQYVVCASGILHFCSAFFMLCGLQVLRLWLERKIFPESVLRRYLNDIGGSSDDMTVSFSFRRPCRAERSIDDPIRELEGMLVDEYGRCGYLAHQFF